MKHLSRLAEGLTVTPLLTQLNQHPALWDQIGVRQAYEGSAHKETRTIVLRGPTSLEGIFDNLTAVDFPVLDQVPTAYALCQDVAVRIGAREIGRVMLVELPPGGRITRHTDEGAYARYYARFHVPITTHLGCRFFVDNESAHMGEGELWWFDHQRPHWVFNESAARRVHLIIDATAPGFTGALKS